MVCIHCGGTTQVTNSRPQKRLNQIWRRRQCISCKAVFTSEEAADYGAAWMIRSASGAVEPFLRDKLLISLLGSLKHRKDALKDAGALTNTVIQKLVDGRPGADIDARTIAQTAQVALNRFDPVASTHYAAFHKQ